MRQVATMAEERAEELRQDPDFQRRAREAITSVRENLIRLENWLETGTTPEA